MPMTKIPVIFIVGPTASGKTALSVELALEFDGEIVSADSMQIYKGIPVATAVPSVSERMGVEHHLLECIDINTEFSVSDYVMAAHAAIEEIHSRNKLPIVVGGTGLYINSLAENIDFGIDDDDGSCRKELMEKAARLGNKAMHDMLCEIDPETAGRLPENDIRRIVRALEVYYITGQTMSRRIAESKNSGLRYQSLFIGVNFKNREILYERINTRVDTMMKNGLLNEAEQYQLLRKGAGAAQAIGHKELLSYLNGEKSLDDAVEDLKRQTRRYAKRQITWFTKNQDVNWLYMDETNNIVNSASQLITSFIEKMM